jgi:hypothetical protein
LARAAFTLYLDYDNTLNGTAAGADGS